MQICIIPQFKTFIPNHACFVVFPSSRKTKRLSVKGMLVPKSSDDSQAVDAVMDCGGKQMNSKKVVFNYKYICASG